MKKIHTYTVTSEYQGLTVEGYVRQILQYSGRSIQRMTRTKAIRLNGKPVYLQTKLRTNDVVTIAEILDETYGVDPEQGPIDVLYEDATVIVLNKPATILVHPTGYTENKTLANYLAYYLQEQNRICKIRPLHRLDRDTSGCVIFAKDAKTQHELESQMKDGNLKRSYLAIVDGCPINAAGTINVPLGKHPKLANRRAVCKDGDEAITHYEVIETIGDVSLLKIQLETGRTHQIRVHLAHIGYPVTGDRMYGKRSPFISRQALHASSLTWMGQNSQTITVEAPLPSDMKRLLERKKTT